MSVLADIYQKLFALKSHTHNYSELNGLPSSITGFPNWGSAKTINTVENVVDGTTYTSIDQKSFLILVFDMPNSGSEGSHPIKIKIENKSILGGVASYTDHWYDHGSAGMMIPLEASTSWSIEAGYGCRMYYQYVPMK